MSVPGSANPLLLASAAAAGAYEIERSVRLNSADSAFLNRTFGSSGNRKTWTWSGWVKRSSLGTNQTVFERRTGLSDSEILGAMFADGNYGTTKDALVLVRYSYYDLITNAVFRDTSAWYHIVIAYDTTQATNTDRLKLYVNGEEQTFSTVTYPTQNADTPINENVEHTLGKVNYFNGCLADIHFIDGQALAPTAFAEFDATTGAWNPIAYAGTYSTNGFHLDFSDNSSSSALGIDSSGNSNNWSVNNITSENPTTLPGVSFDGTNDYIESADDADYTFGSNDWTIECFVKSRDLSSHKAVVMKYSGTASTSSWWMSLLNGQISFFFYYGSGSQISGTTSSSITANVWSHLAVTRDGNTVRLYIDGVQSGTINVTGLTMNDTATPVRIAVDSQGNYDFNGIISNVRIVNGTCLYPSGTTFTVPAAPLTSVTNTKLLCCQSNSSVTTAAVSPNTLTASGDAFAGTFSDSTAAEDSLRDSPTNGDPANASGLGGELPGNYCTWNPISKYNGSSDIKPENGNLEVAPSSVTYAGTISGTIAIPKTGKWYWEIGSSASGFGNILAGIETEPQLYYAGYANGASMPLYAGTSAYSVSPITNNGSPTWAIPSSTSDVFGIAVDMDAGDLYLYFNGAIQNSGNAIFNNLDLVTENLFPSMNSTNGCRSITNFGQRPFAYAAPSGYKALCTANLPDPTIADGSTAMDVALYTGTSSTQSITGLNFEPDFVWLKARSEVRSHHLFDVVRGATNFLKSDSTDAETTDVNTLTSFDSSGFSLGSSAKVNNNTQTYAGWAWDGGSSTVTNTDGSITSSVRANASAGFSIVTASPSGTADTYGHGLGVTPSLIISKRRDSSSSWYVRTSFLANPGSHYLVLNTTAAVATDTSAWANTAANSSVITVNASYLYGGSADLVSYCFAPVEGYSAFGSYTGNGSTDGTFVYTGFRPAFVLLKCSSAAGTYWSIQDNKRLGYNPDQDLLFPNNSDSENPTSYMDFLSNGFKLRINSSFANGSGSTYVWAAFAEHPFRTARAR